MMMDRNTQSTQSFATPSIAPASFGARCLSLSVAAHAVREQSIREGGDLAGWQLSHLMRDAHTVAEVDFSEEKYRVWLQAHRS